MTLTASTPASAHDLPTELLVAIFQLAISPRQRKRRSFNHHKSSDSDEPGLVHACSLVCRQWRTIYLPFLFANTSVKVHGNESISRFLACFKGHPHAAQAIQDLSMSGDSGDVDLLRRLAAILETCRSLRHLALKYFRTDNPRLRGPVVAVYICDGAQAGQACALLSGAQPERGQGQRPSRLPVRHLTNPPRLLHRPPGDQTRGGHVSRKTWLHASRARRDATMADRRRQHRPRRPRLNLRPFQ
ncbi:hypothetical protein C8Q80DRAFT_358825 [Daedaleopsis nitida]|nr:hypothetical protein C8Q80DRAFT_358825 [Daedaleopsis nitida]